ncbi:sulfatase [Candidatus Poribacteria bacterium]|nr:sulfatase [Candidatus Poribacteria bacterium]|tara:strand:+ start:430 stop:1869 length:1440 start_codon:yes stop_codon:yes gene_type:complete
MHPQFENIQNLTRRHFLKDIGLGSIALTTLMEPTITASPTVNPMRVKPAHTKPKAKRIIYLHMTGSPPNLDLYDYKPELVKRDGQNCPNEFLKDRRFAFTTGIPKLMGTRRQFAQYGESGLWLSDAIPNFRSIADEMCMIRSMYTDQFNHAPAELMVYTGSPRSGRPSMGSWVTYGLGSENENLPGFVVLISSGVQPNGGNNSYGSGFLPSVYQGIQCRSKGDPVLYTSNPPGVDRSVRRQSLDTLQQLNELQAKEMGHPETLTRIAQYELAFRMQVSVPEVMDISREPDKILEAYGAEPGRTSLANNCLLARRLVESGVRFVQLFDWGWDFHGTGPDEDIRDGLTRKCATMDKPILALINDLKSRGLLDETLIIWGGEFGRTPFREGRTSNGEILGRDHYPDCYSMWMAGGGVKSGLTYGKTDELGFSITENPVHVHDLQATILHLLGLDHEKLTFRFQGRDYRLTDVHGEVIHDLVA